jgi:protein-tyrosine phosphatase
MIDVHHHCLHGIDDGPRELSEAVDLCAASAAEGIETIIATPHVFRGRWLTPDRETIDRRIAELHERTNGIPHIVAGSEYFFGHDMNELLESNGGIVPLNDTRYVLVEFASQAIPPMVEQPFYRAQLAGWTPVIAHPERNLVFQKKPELLEALVQSGAKTQVTSASFTGQFGSAAERTAVRLLQRGLVHVIATDAHNVSKRPPVVIAARAIVEQLAGAAVAQSLFIDNPAAVLGGRTLPYDPEIPYPAEQIGLLGKIARFLRR